MEGKKMKVSYEGELKRVSYRIHKGWFVGEQTIKVSKCQRCGFKLWISPNKEIYCDEQHNLNKDGFYKFNEKAKQINSFRMTYDCLKCGKDNNSTDPKDFCLLCDKINKKEGVKK